MEITKRAVSIFLAAILTFSMLSVNIFAADAAQEDVVIVYGDVNKDGKVSIADAFMLLLSRLGFVSLDETQKFYGDVDADGNVGYTDIWLISKYSLGLIISFPVFSTAWQEGEETEDTHFLDSCYKYDEETDLFEYCFDITIPEEDEISVRSIMYIKGNKYNTTIRINNFNSTVIFDGEKNYVLIPKICLYGEIDNDNYITDLDDNEILSLINELSYVGSTINTFGGIDYICEKYTSDGDNRNFWFTTAGKAVRMELLGDAEDETFVIIINEFSPDVDDSVFTIPSFYVKIDFEKLLKLSYVIFR